MNEDRISLQALEEAETRLAALMDIAEEEDRTVPGWTVAAHAAVRNQIRRKKRGDG